MTTSSNNNGRGYHNALSAGYYMTGADGRTLLHPWGRGTLAFKPPTPIPGAGQGAVVKPSHILRFVAGGWRGRSSG